MIITKVFIPIHFCLNTQSINVWWNYNNVSNSDVWKFSKNLPQPAITFGMLMYQNMYIDLAYNLRKFTVDKTIQIWMLDNNVWKYPKNKQRAFHNLQLHLACRYIKICILIRHIFCESLVKICATKHKCQTILFFGNIGLLKLIQFGL